MAERTPFPRVFWIANLIEVLERFAYYGIYFSFGIYLTSLGFSRDQLGVVQTVFLLLSYCLPLFSGTLADRFGFKPMLIVAYLAYLPAILLLIFTKSFSGIALTMLSIGFAAGIFKPLIFGTVRAVTDKTNSTVGVGIFYAMVNVGGSLGPVVAGALRAISWDYAFMAAAAAIGLMLLITIFFYKEPKREIEQKSFGEKLGEIREALTDLRFTVFLVLLGIGFWIPFWAFFNLCALYVDSNLDTARLYEAIRSVLGSGVANFLSHDVDGERHILGETISHTGYIIMLLQVIVSRTVEKAAALPVFFTGLAVAAVGFVVLGLAATSGATLVFLGILLFAIGEMIASPRIQEYIARLAPKEKAGLYVGTNFLAVGVGAFSGVLYTPLYGRFSDAGHPGYVWYVLAAHTLLGLLALAIFQKVAGTMEERQEEAA
ncbi:MAG: MFS transporter [Acidobacteria bacterium]|nr:MFS transporter [Acidobacteriota bacterium]MCB9378848.1 MFS transporter [Holophagales bacterium]